MGRKWGRTGEIFDAHMGDIERDFEGGAELRDIAKKYGVSAPTITNWLIESGYKHRSRGRYPIAMKEKAVELAGRGWEPVAIAKLLRVKLRYARQWLDLDPEPESTVLGRDVVRMDELEGMRHKVGRRWTREQKERVFGFLQAPEVFTVANIYKLTGASRDRQQKIWIEFNTGEPFPLPKKQRGFGVPTPEPAFEPLPEPFRVDAALEFERGKLAGLAEARQFLLSAAQWEVPIDVIERELKKRQLALAGGGQRALPGEEQLALPPAEQRALPEADES
jgi:hypothetical protein